MLTQKELRIFFRDKTKQIETVDTLEGLQAYLANATPDDPMLEVVRAGIEDLEATVSKTAREMKIREEEVDATLALLEDVTIRVPARLHYFRGLLWCEVADVMKTTEYGIKTRVSRAMKGVIPRG